MQLPTNSHPHVHIPRECMRDDCILLCFLQVDSVSVLRSDDMPCVPAECFKSTVSGVQAVSKGRQGRQALNKVQVENSGWHALPRVKCAPARAHVYTYRPQLPPWAIVVPPVPDSLPIPLQILLCNVRLPTHSTDLLLTMNTPVFISEASAAAEQAGAGYKQEYLHAPELFKRMLASFQIKDWGLFSRG
jgi:hypothetical protein